jgi:hypothetical protein
LFVELGGAELLVMLLLLLLSLLHHVHLHPVRRSEFGDWTHVG